MSRLGQDPPTPHGKRGWWEGDPSRFSLARPYWMRRRIPQPGYLGLSCWATLSQRGCGQAGGNTASRVVSLCAGAFKNSTWESWEVWHG
jgi:hypothetical protein